MILLAFSSTRSPIPKHKVEHLTKRKQRKTRNEKKARSKKMRNKNPAQDTNENLARNQLYPILEQPPLHPLVVPFKVGACRPGCSRCWLSRYNETVLTILNLHCTPRSSSFVPVY
ncbi:hypothetical protein K440DRAFT_243545 [Wilcoxina mikolae CBS 423.85]|nr:hypothetical protein K440DRAFT_243545 [Wilcoxina mikolae CBS 423.85]